MKNAFNHVQTYADHLNVIIGLIGWYFEDDLKIEVNFSKDYVNVMWIPQEKQGLIQVWSLHMHKVTIHINKLAQQQ